MTDQSAAPSGGSDISVIELPNDAPESFADESAAARYFASLHDKKPEKQAAESADDATADPELAKANAESPETETISEDQEVEPDKPAIDPPKSWTKDLHEHWNALDPVLQERIVARDREDQAAIKRAFNEAADARKAIETELAQTKEARQQYEAKTKAALEVLEREQLRDFPDIRTMADVAKMAMEDPFRKIQWDVHQDQIRAATWEAQQADQRKANEEQTNWNQHVQKENTLAVDLIPELADPEKKAAFYKRAVERLGELGFKQEEVNDLANGRKMLSIHDHRLQALLKSDFKRADIEKAKVVVAETKLPPVQRPGTARPQGHAAAERAQALDKSLTNSGDFNDAVALLRARRGSR